MITVKVSELQEGMVAAQTICDDKGLVLLGKGIPLTKVIIERLRRFNIYQVSIKSDSDAELLSSVFTPAGQKAVKATDKLLGELSNHNTVNIDGRMSKIKQIIYSILAKDVIQRCLQEEAQNEALYNHSLRTTLLAVNMGLCQGYDYINLEYLAMCALLHDCGMGSDFDENDASHTYKGYKKLRNNLDLDIIVAVVCLQHHERFDGRGTPIGLKRTQITEFARLIAVADYYDLLIMRQNSPRQAVFKVLSASGRELDPEMVKLFETSMFNEEDQFNFSI